MRCKACDKVMESGEIKWSEQHKEWDLCSRCKVYMDVSDYEYSKLKREEGPE